MSSSGYDFNVTLYRDSLSTPWGFRLEGGRDFHYPLTIQRVFAGSPACSDLQRGDIITAINHQDATYLLHNDANELIRGSGGSINLGIKRTRLNFMPVAPVASNPVEKFKLDPYNLFPAQKPAYILKQQSNKSDCFMSAVTNGPIWLPTHCDDSQEMYVRSQSTHKVRDPKPILSQTGSSCVPLGLTQVGNRSSVKRYRPASTMPILQRSSYSEPGVFTQSYKGTNEKYTSNQANLQYYDKKMVGQIQQSLSKAVNHPVGYPINGPAPVAHPVDDHFSSHLSINNPSNRSSPMPPFRPGSSLAASTVPPLPTSKVFSHHEVSQQAPIPRKPDGPKVVMQQYNSPAGLYSREAFQEEYYKQVGPQSNTTRRSAAPTPISHHYQLQSSEF